MKNKRYFNIENIIKEIKLSKKFPFCSIIINSKKFDIKKKLIFIKTINIAITGY